MSAGKGLATLQQTLGYAFRQQALLREALTHASATKSAREKTYERLEFLGDRVLGLVLAEALLRLHPDAAEGDLAPRHTLLVRAETCAKVAASLQLGDHLILGTSELQTGGRTKNALLADVCEAVIGAIFLDSGYAVAQDMVLRAWEPYLHNEPERLRDAKTLLQEWAQAQGHPLPRYSLIERDGPDHAPEFVMEVEVASLQPTRGRGATKRHAEQEAAETFMKREKVWPS